MRSTSLISPSPVGEGVNGRGLGKAKQLMEWITYEDGKTIGSTGSEGGVILRDEECPDGARITLEEETHMGVPFAITCGVYGWLVHTRTEPFHGPKIAISYSSPTCITRSLPVALRKSANKPGLKSGKLALICLTKLSGD